MSDSETFNRVIVLQTDSGSPFERTRAVPNSLDRQPFYLAIAIALKTGHAEQVFNRKGALPEAFLWCRHASPLAARTLWAVDCHPRSQACRCFFNRRRGERKKDL